VDGAGAGESIVFGVILGTGVGGGIVVNERVLVGRHSIAGEWGHTPLPWPVGDEAPGKPCFCGNTGCAERYLCGSALAEDCDGSGHRDASGIVERAERGDEKAKAALDRHAERLARGLAQIINILDPHVIVLGGGLSNMKHLYSQVPPLLGRHVISPQCTTPIKPNLHGDSSGVRGAAWLWPRELPVSYRTSGS
ncbi:MAG: ROK family protein, partial [Gluconacetobacter diazotrophicus]|nr:ROK family protein [Gluconacetobacter diazotrophicus]